MTETGTDTGMQTVPVHVTNAHELARPAGPRDTSVSCRTFTLKAGQTSGDPNGGLIARILDRDPARTQALVVVNTGTVYLCHSSAQADAAAGDASTIGGAQDGALVTAGQYLPPLKTTDPVWAVIPTDKAAAGALVSVIAERRRG